MKKISDQDRAVIIENNKKVSELLAANEKILLASGYDVPKENFAFDPESEQGLRIQVPTGYIRTKSHYMSEYALFKICNGDNSSASNIAYSLEVSDFYNYIFNRFGIYGAILSMVYKQATINIVSIIEIIIKSYMQTLQQKCKNCPVNNMCKGRITKNSVISIFKKQLDEYKNKKIFDWPDEKYQAIKDFYDYRNHIHISKATENEYKNHLHSRDRYNQAISMMKEIDTDMKTQIDLYTLDVNCIRYVPK